MRGQDKRNFNRRRGTILMTSLIMVMLISFGAVMLAKMVIDLQRLDIRRRNLTRAYYAAQGGISLVRHWSNYPQDYTINPNLFVMGTTQPGFQNLRTALTGSGITVSQEMLNTLNEGAFRSVNNYDVAKLTKLELLPPAAGDPVSCLLKVKATGQSVNSNITRTILAYLDINVAYIPPIPAGLISYNAAAMGGNAKVHWGEAWSKNSFNMVNESQLGYLSGDAWAKWRCEGIINFAGGGWNNGSDYDDDPPTTQPGLGAYSNVFYHRLAAGTLQWPVFDYKTFKDMALSHGRYYSTDAAGNIYRDGIEDAAHKIDFLTEFGITNRDVEPYRLYFIDTVNGQPPAADGSNLATVHVSGTGKGLKGVLWMGVNFDASGVGNPPLVTNAKDPDSVTHSLNKIFLEGVLYAAGTVEMSGNCGTYGSVIAQKGFVGGGTPDIYYNKQLNQGLLLDNGNTGSRFKVVLQSN